MSPGGQFRVSLDRPLGGLTVPPHVLLGSNSQAFASADDANRADVSADRNLLFFSWLNVHLLRVLSTSDRHRLLPAVEPTRWARGPAQPARYQPCRTSAPSLQVARLPQVNRRPDFRA